MGSKMGNEYTDHWIMTFTGKKFHFLNPQPEEIDIIDIAHHLSLLCRFTGACNQFYSVGEHSIRVSSILLTKELKFAGLLHDAAEAYINDISRPVKYSHKLEETEKIITKAIEEKYGIREDLHGVIKDADDLLLTTETRDLGLNVADWAKLPDPIPFPYLITPLSSGETERMFLRMFEQLGGEL